MADTSRSSSLASSSAKLGIIDICFHAEKILCSVVLLFRRSAARTTCHSNTQPSLNQSLTTHHVPRIPLLKSISSPVSPPAEWNPSDPSAPASPMVHHTPTQLPLLVCIKHPLEDQIASRLKACLFAHLSRLRPSTGKHCPCLEICLLTLLDFLPIGGSLIGPRTELGLDLLCSKLIQHSLQQQRLMICYTPCSSND